MNIHRMLRLKQSGMQRLLRKIRRDPENRIDDRLHKELGYRNVKRYTVDVKEMPAYRFVVDEAVYEALWRNVIDRSVKHGLPQAYVWIRTYGDLRCSTY